MHQSLRLFFLFLFLTGWSTNAYSQSVFGWIIEASGVIEVRSAEEETWKVVDTTVEYELSEGDRVRTRSDSKAVVLTLDARELEVLPSSELLMGPEARVQRRSNGTLVTRLKFVLEQTFSRRKPFNPGIRRGVGSEPPVLITPRTGKVLSGDPDFVWLTANPKPDSYTLRVLRESGDAAIELTISDTTAQYPSKMDKLVGGAEYQILLYPTELPKDVERGSFYVATDEEKEEYNTLKEQLQSQYSSGVSADIILASVLLEDGFYADALAILLDIEKKGSALPLVNYLKSQVYYEAGPMLLIP